MERVPIGAGKRAKGNGKQKGKKGQRQEESQKKADTNKLSKERG